MITPLLRIALLAGLAIASTASAAPRAAQLGGWWQFDQFQGHLSPDRSGNGNDLLVAYGGTTKGIAGTALDCDGRRTRVSCPNTQTLSPTDALTLEAWVRLRSVDGAGIATVLRKDDAYSLRFAKGRPGLVLWSEGKHTGFSWKTAKWETGRWYYLAATYDGNQVRLFVDGKEDASRAFTGKIDASDAPLMLGCAGSQSALDGGLDEVRLWRRALPADEIAAAWRAGEASQKRDADKVVAQRTVGGEFPVLRKPARDVRMEADGFLWIEAEDFADYGGWLMDTQFTHLMGSAYLIAATVGKPIDDAQTEIVVPRAGKWHLWVRTKNWLKDFSPGQFGVILGDKPSKRIFGASPVEKWGWESGGQYDLPQGPLVLRLKDLTGAYARCDAIVLTTDAKYTPPDDATALEKERARLTGLSLEPKFEGEYDVVVVGAGAAGCCAAISAARTGAKTALVQDRPVLGGNSSIELGVPINGAGSSHANARESGVIEEAGRIKARYNYHKMSEPFALVAAQEKNLTVFLNRHVLGADKAGPDRIVGVQCRDTYTGARSYLRGKMFIDCTGDGWLGFYAGAKYRVGREAREEFNESHAPTAADRITMSGCLMGQLCLSFRSVDTGKPNTFVPPDWASRLPKGEALGRHIRSPSGEWWLEHPGDIDTLCDAEKSRDELIRISYGYWDYLKNSWTDRQRAATLKLAYVPINEGKRESRRLVGDYILTQNDVQQAVLFPDRIAHAGWPLDVHHPRGIFSGKEGPFHSNDHLPVHNLPYRIIYSVNIENLLMAGRNASVSHIALGTVRVQGTLSTLGQAAGTAAGLCLKHNLSPRQLGQQRLAELQQTLLKHDQYIVQMKNEDPADLARAATVTATSEATYEEFNQRALLPDESHPMTMPRAMMFPRGETREVNEVVLLLSSAAKQPVELKLHVRQGDKPGDFSSRDDLTTAKASVAPGRHFVAFAVKAKIEKPFAWVWLESAPDVSWYMMTRAPHGSCRAYGGDKRAAWTVVDGQYYALFTRPGLRLPADYRASNIIDGVTRIEGSQTHLWSSDPAQPLPQSIELKLPKPAALNTVYLTFDTDMNAPFHTVPLPAECVRDYTLSCLVGGQWKPVAEVEGNFQRRHVHRFDPLTTDRVRLTVRATNGAPAARVFEIRLYNE